MKIGTYDIDAAILEAQERIRKVIERKVHFASRSRGQRRRRERERSKSTREEIT